MCSVPTTGATGHVFGLWHLLGYQFAPDQGFKDCTLYTIEKPGTWCA